MSTDLRITGLMSGIDTESMIESLMDAERIKVDSVKQDRQLVLWRQEMYNDLNKQFANFILNTKKNLGLTTVTSTGSYISNSYKNLSWVKQVVSSNTSIASVSSSRSVFDGIYNVEVKQLAKGVSAVSSESINSDDSISSIIGEGQDSIEFSLNGEIIAIGNFENEDGVLEYDGKLVDSNGYQIDSDGNHVLDENGEKIFVAKVINLDLSEAALEDVVKNVTTAINSIKDIGVRASYDSTYNRFFLQTKDTGEDSQILIEDIENGESFINALNLNVNYSNYEGESDPGSDFKLGVTYKGQDAVISFDGADNITSSSNNITLNGISMNIKDIGEFTVTVSTDVDGVYEKISNFVEEYNKLVDQVNELLTEKRYYDYDPLTDAQKEEMDEKEIELWEEKAKSGLLRNDDILESTMQNIRYSIYEEFEGDFSLITEIGITTEKYSSGSAGGKLTIDEAKLKEKIRENPEGVMELLFKGSSSESDGGIVTRIYDNLITGMEDIIKKSGTGDNANLYRNVKSNILIDFVTEYGSISLLDKEILDYNDRIDDLNYALSEKEEYYYQKFAALETAISQMNAQSMWLSQQFSSNY